MDESVEQSVGPENPAEEQRKQAVYEAAAVESVQTGQAFIERSLVGQVQAQGNAEVQRSLAGAVVAGANATIQACAAAVVVAGAQVTITSSYNEVLVAGADVRAEKSFLGVVIANEVHLGEGSRVLLNTPQAVAFGLAAGVAMALTMLKPQRRKK